MKKHTIMGIFFLILSSIVYGEDIYTDVKDSIIYLEDAIYIDKEDSLYPGLFERIEKRSEIKLLNANFPMQSGSGFIITQDGYALTNSHVILLPKYKILKKQISYNYAKYLLDEYGNDFTSSEKENFIYDFSQLIDHGTYKLIAYRGEDEFDVEVLCVAKSDEPDIALLKLKDESDQTFSSLKLVNEETINEKLIGETVYSFGYPLGLTIESIFNDKVASMNRGNVSAYRDDELGIQHNAAISKGNSGGPLVNENREVLGINTALLEEGNSLYYAIASDKILTFLYDSGYENIIKWNARTDPYSETDGNLQYNIMGEIESSSDLLVYAEEGSKIYIDGLYIGTSPMYYTLKKDLTEIRIESETGLFDSKIRRLSSLTGTTTFAPDIKRTLIPCSFTEEDEEHVSVYADGRYLGKTPLTVDLSEDEYLFQFLSHNKVYKPLSLLIHKDHSEIDIHGERAYPLQITGLETDELSSFDENQLKMALGILTQTPKRELLFRKGEYELSFFPEDDVILPEGTWIFTFNGFPQYDGLEVPIIMNSEGFILDLNGPAGSGDLLIRNLPEDSHIFADGILQDTLIDNNIVQLPLGIRNIHIWNPKYEPYDAEITVRPDDSACITYQKKTGHARKARRWLWGGLAVGAGGLALALIDTDSYAVDRSETYNDYRDLKHKIGIVSSSMIIAGIIALIPSLVERGKYSEQKKEYQSLLESQDEK